MKTMAAAVDSVAWWIDRTFANVSKQKRTLAYIGTADLLYPIILFAGIKTGWKTMFVSPRNPTIQNLGLLQQADVSVLLYGEAMWPVAKNLRQFDSSIIFTQVPPLAEVLESQPPPYRFEHSFAEVKDEKCLILHSSGSTGQPKLVALTHGTFSCTDSDPSVPVPEGRRPQNAAQFDFSPPGRFYSCFPPYHLAGVQAYIILPTLAHTATIVMGPPSTPPSGFMVDAIIKQQDLRAMFIPPSIIEQWTSGPNAFHQAERLNFVLFGGGPLAPSVGNKLSQVTDVCQMYGSLEIGQVQMLVPQAGEWEYLEPNPAEECDMQEVDDGVFEMVLHQDEKFKNRRSLSHTYPDVKTWRTKDLFVPHPTKPGLWRFHSRTDDILVLASSHKVWPIPMEMVLQGDPLVAGALMVGNGRPEVLLLIEPRKSPEQQKMSKKEFIDAIWPSIVKANSIAPDYGKVRRSRILLSDPNLGFFRTPKGTISRKPTESLYAEYIATAFIDGVSDEQSEIGILENHWMNETKNFIRSIVHDIHSDNPLEDTDDFFVAKAMDSLTVVELGQKLRLGLVRRMKRESNTLNFWLRTIFENPSIDSLSKATLDITFGQGQSEFGYRKTHGMEQLLEDLTADLPEPATPRAQPPSPSDGVRVVLLGSRGRLGPFMVKDFLDDPQVTSLKCLDRGNNGRSAFQRQANVLDLQINLDDPRLEFVSVDISKPDLNLPQEQLNDISKNTNVIIHNVWAVNFALSLPSFGPEILQSLSTTIKIANNAASRPRLVFMSSVGAVQGWASAISPNVAVPEEVIRSPEVATLTGYAQSKHVAERLLDIAGERLQIPISILRLGQVAGPTSMGNAGKWESNDWMHSLAIMSKASGLIPNDMGSVDWIPVDMVSRVVRDITLQTRQDPSAAGARLYNLVHPRPIPFTTFADALQGCISSGRQVPFSKWVELLSNLPPNSLSKNAEAEKIRILPFFQSVVGCEFPHFALHNAQAASPTMAQLEPLDLNLLRKWCQQWT
ncbi:hypothetical protein NUU61_002860 [Penicillium alfredii]|uniref:Carrier domain-containing protein n=1 Tax=Penicillium alfredii TaxID=1506179 RepID=A0A9W9FSH7_9EURO|nr:uncharacterized protein NUU61_002860 [Penicillium alfredii]KAJ5105513.1 hypothetical protein NUU61_002860 [Penicillium alfredii]